VLPDAPVHITVGTGGIAFDDGVWNASWSVEHCDPSWGYGTLRVQNRSHVQWTYTSVTRGLDGVVRDSVRDQVWIAQRL
jgi:hypothetical protein